ncbi:MAG: lexA [Rhodospirillales bacterium]|nr:lexA [Rhodospirillales bacterium]
MLTRKQHELLMLIHERMQAEGIPPSFDEMKDALGLKSKSGVHRLVSALEERGFLRRLHHRARALEVIKLPDTQGRVRLSPAGFRPQVIQGDFQPLQGRSVEPEGDRDAVQLPLYGKIAAGTPIEALRDHGNYVEVPSSLLGAGDYYALKVTGDSMIDAGILDDDTVIIRRDETAENGAIVVALVDGQEATLKRLRRKGNTVALEPANQAHKIQLYGADRVRVQGRLVGLIRKY